ncbi:MAG: hypothetical protein M3444_09665 [Acidobacteriota bacterium]|nr:hypothetical protein [Acidobacteriota bacterium]
MSGGDPPIIIQGGSVTIEFDQSQLKPDAGKFSSQGKVIKRVEITGTGLQNYDQSAVGNDVTIKITYGDP